MKDKMDFDNFEEFLQSEVNNQKMFPSDRVWNNIAKQIQPPKPWPALTLISLLIVLSLGIATFMNYPPKTNLLSNIYKAGSDRHLSNNHININNSINSVGLQPIHNLTVAWAVSKIGLIATSQKVNHDFIISKSGQQLNRPTLFNEIARNSPVHDAFIFKSENAPLSNKILDEVIDVHLLAHPNVKVAIARNVKQGITSIDYHYPNRMRSMNRPRLPNSIQYEIYTTPTRSYRTLQNDQVLSQISSINASNVNSQVKQKAELGSELGLGIRYKLSNNVTFKTGLQFNIRQYSIDAYKSAGGLATIQVVQNNKVETLGITSSFSNTSIGEAETKLNNKLYQVSIPLGVDWNIYDTKNIGINIGASLQPTYSLNRNVYIISTDYKYYANGESLFRKWNINSCINAGITYKLKSATISFGPQLRYQHLSTFVDKYPIKEYRMDYGIRLGVVKTIK